MQGLFKLVETHGIPLDIVIEQHDNNDMIIDWIHFYESSQKCGWNISTTINKIEAALTDIKGKDYCDEVINRLKDYISMNQRI